MSKVFSVMSSEATALGIARQMAEQRRVSTDPNWPPADMETPEGGQAAKQPPQAAGLPHSDGRHARSASTKAKILAVCRGFMLAGSFRPSMAAICRRVPCAIRTAYWHFRDVEALHLEAAKDATTRDAILNRLHGEIVRAIITGRAD